MKNKMKKKRNTTVSPTSTNLSVKLISINSAAKKIGLTYASLYTIINNNTHTLEEYGYVKRLKRGLREQLFVADSKEAFEGIITYYRPPGRPLR